MEILITFLWAWGGVEALYFLTRFTKAIPKLDVVDDLNANGTNNGVGIKMNRRVMRTNENAEGIFAQEYREFFSRPTLTMRLVEFLSKKMQRRTEYKGHAAEIAWRQKFIDDTNIEAYLRSEARALTRYKQFKGISEEEIYQQLKLYDNDAMWYISKHEHDIKRMFGKLQEKV